MDKGQGKQQANYREAVAPVFAGIEGAEDYPYEGRLDFVSTGLDPNTGTILLRAVYKNPRSATGVPAMVPGMFVRLRIPIDAREKALLVSDRALADQVDPDSIAGNSSTTEDDGDADVTITSPVTSSLTITNTVNNPTPSIGSNVVFTITVNNPSGNPYPATGVSVNAPLPAGLTLVSCSATVGSYNGVNWTGIGSLAVGGSATLTVTARVTSTGSKSFSAQVSSNEFPNSTATATVTPISTSQADLSLSQTMSRSTTGVGRVDLRITVRNNDATNPATGVQVKDLLPSGLTYVSHTSTMSYSSSTGIWTVGTLAPNASSTLTITAKVATDGDATRNFAEIWRSEQYDPDSTPANGEQGADRPGHIRKRSDFPFSQT